jgi:hypothetical protein
MTETPPNDPHPRSTIQLAGQTAHELVNGLKQSPTILALVVLVIVGVVFDFWFMRSLLAMSDSRAQFLLEQLVACKRT